MEGRCPRGFSQDILHQQPIVRGRWESMSIAIPFLVCFSTFGILNLIGGTILTVLSCRPKLTPRAMSFMQKLFRRANLELPSQIDPMRVVGIMLLVTGTLLVVIGIALGIIACRSAKEQQRRRERMAMSGFPKYNGLEKSSRHTSSIGSTSFSSMRGRNGGKRILEKTVSPILEVNSEDECEKLDVEIHKSYGSNSSVRDQFMKTFEDKTLTSASDSNKLLSVLEARVEVVKTLGISPTTSTYDASDTCPEYRDSFNTSHIILSDMKNDFLTAASSCEQDRISSNSETELAT